MNIVYSSSDAYSLLAGISLTSLLENNKDVDNINIIIIDNEISEDNKLRLIKTAEKYNRNLKFVPLGGFLRNTNINLQKWDISTFGRLFEASALQEHEKVIHIDCDTIVNGPLKYLWDIDMGCAVIAGAPDCLSDNYKLNIGLKPADKYFNAGILVINLVRIRELHLEKVFSNYIEKNSKFLTYVDQEVLNACIRDEEKIELPLIYNSYSILHYLEYKQLKVLRHVRNMFSEDAYLKARNNPVIVHYTGCFIEGTRPWIEGDDHPRKYLFDKYKNISEWKDVPKWKDNRTISSKFICWLIKSIPKLILAPIVGYIHGVYIPSRNQKRKYV